MENKKTFWPYGILISIILIVIACIVTIYIASKAPVYDDNFYFDTYENVDRNYNEIQKRQKQFDENFKLSLDNESFEDQNKIIYLINDGKNSLKINVENFKNYDLNQLQIQALLTRPHTNEMDQKLEAIVVNSSLVFDFNISEKGVWKLLIKITQNEESIGFFEFFIKTK
ncbi:hypothetical protein FVD15_01525 [Campylobacter volucris]|uniref:Cytochrome c oxidase-associated protein CcoH n=1 Tax=Campylobacter volucris TaxID=1031542 RepID=A0AAE5YJB3_9BACT|nr:FixH family protein [Campylobacter volucris]AJC93711.1 putative cytochrome c oxidase-associated protein CcoH [Campylobacter volucris LMG 24379]KAB0579810.1 hypothetical protein F7P61_03185 [Campylobacter volucris]QBL13908.1 hypothetical protein A9460_06120 [Campylobacter volucris]QEL07924.1 putative cytochrome c oxidase-associated protein CcoH [Campylobacter volucris]TXK70734.1 hypothetical protein FVD15_01525 [Campylobacter volucris]